MHVSETHQHKSEKKVENLKNTEMSAGNLEFLDLVTNNLDFWEQVDTDLEFLNNLEFLESVSSRGREQRRARDGGVRAPAPRGPLDHLCLRERVFIWP